MKILLFNIFMGLIISLENVLCTFKSEYPNVKICSSGLTFLSHINSDLIYQNLMVIRKNNCTHLQGSLYVRHLKNVKEIILDSLIEISGDVVIEFTSLEKISMKNLKVIRGYSKREIKYDNKLYNVSLQVSANTALESFDLRNLRSIHYHNVIFGNNPRLKYVPITINWMQLFLTNDKQKFLYLNEISTISKPVCHTKCGDFCWGPNADQCQLEVKCKGSAAESCNFCFKSSNIETCCDSQCLGGCYGHGPKKCYSCLNYLNEDKCMEGCPSKYKSSSGVAELNPNFKYLTSSFCSKQCPVDMKIEDTRCVYECSKNFYLNNTECKPCYGDLCNNLPCDLLKINKEYYSPFNFLTGETLRQLENCTVLNGPLLIAADSFNKYNVTVPDLYKYMKNIRELNGGFHYAMDNTLKNLTFLENLKSFQATHFQSSPELNINSRFYIVKTKLEILGLRSLKSVNGTLIIFSNDQLCTNIPWKTVQTSGKSAIIANKATCDTKCHTECAKNYCWGPGNNMCYECKNFEAGKICVANCSNIIGFYKADGDSNRTNTCSKCHTQCAKTCKGPLNTDCIGGCKNKEQNGSCIISCSHNYYEDKNSNKCLPCNEACYNSNNQMKVCTGGLALYGANGCNFCKAVLLNEYKMMESCISECPSGTYITSEVKNYWPLLPGNVKFGCAPCHKYCAECNGFSNDKNNCKKCIGVWFYKRCLNTCPKEKSYSKTSDNVCLPCHVECKKGCNGPNETDCTRCQNKKMYLDKSNFTCIESCPPEKNIEELESSTSETVCVTLEESRNRKEEVKRTKITLAIVLTMILIVIILIIGIVIFLKRKSHKERLENEMKAHFSNLAEPCSKDEDGLNRPANMGRLAIISIDDLMFDDETKPLGFGAFGYVYKGRWRVPKEEGNLLRKNISEFFLPVAIKVIKNLGMEEKESIMEEAKIMASVSHKHCLRFIGISLSYEKPCLVTSYLKEGSLDKYLIRNKMKITSLIMLRWAEQIADGMLYLKRRNIIHRDLACRNVLVNQLEFVQITDFGLSKMLENTKDKEIIIKSGKVPIRWLAYETLTDGIYSHETDVWAYGVTLWEIFTFGKVPYEDQDTTDIADFVLKGGRLRQPDICSLDVYINLVNCWLESPNLRPDFENLMNIFANYCKNPGRYLSIEGDPYEIPSPTNMEMTSMVSFNDHQHPDQLTAETALPLINRESTRTRESHFSNNSNNNNAVNLNHNQTMSDEKDLLPTRTNKSLNPFKKLYDNRSSNQQGQRDTISQDRSNNASDDESRYQPYPSTDPAVQIRNPSQLGQKTHPNSKHLLLTETPRFRSSNSDRKTLPPPVHPALIDAEDGYLEPVRGPNNNRPTTNASSDEYLEPLKSPTNQYINSEPINKSPNLHLSNFNKNNYQNDQFNIPLLSSPDIQNIDESDQTPVNLYFPHNLANNEYLEPKYN